MLFKGTHSFDGLSRPLFYVCNRRIVQAAIDKSVFMDSRCHNTFRSVGSTINCDALFLSYRECIACERLDLEPTAKDVGLPEAVNYTAGEISPGTLYVYGQ